LIEQADQDTVSKYHDRIVDLMNAAQIPPGLNSSLALFHTALSGIKKIHGHGEDIETFIVDTIKGWFEMSRRFEIKEEEISGKTTDFMNEILKNQAKES